MQLEWARPGVLKATAHAVEFAALVAAARFVAESAPPDIPEESLRQLRHILRDYDAQARRLRDAPSPPGPHGTGRR
ncbi:MULTISPECIES: hypothetical protein [unclassified Streptomyces]|uniref:hypothetical protein n=1 Tax=unclassified Streptomyces TaxID=2593676 RepID=UPI0004461B2B|nr:hypothetical protein [Streptomyces sp. PCS3-D2]WKV70531.1 hypothetical protein AW27_002770 [Streptomyces sp. PCS3-D2]